ncbi:hypothetical protein D1AOALGA4SA_858 [Olavius algarvensis Delta 1 endosymbiont]|nr:hypothetical protein D1AOALGA4SA_858 [Olavius algarvensis Delta 1 endosymbiont]
MTNDEWRIKVSCLFLINTLWFSFPTSAFRIPTSKICPLLYRVDA